MKIALCLLIKDENDYLDEWISYHKNIGIDNFIIYDNDSATPIKSDLDYVKVVRWSMNNTSTQIAAYFDCAKNNQDFDYIGFIDTDEFYVSKTMNIKEDFNNLKEKFGDFVGLGLYWRFYGKQQPYYETRMKIDDYVEYHSNGHIKSFIKPKNILNFNNPHHALIQGNYIDELGNPILSAIGNHTSQNIWIKHIWTRSASEFELKIKRGSGDKCNRNYNMNHFYDYNNHCTINDKNKENMKHFYEKIQGWSQYHDQGILLETILKTIQTTDHIKIVEVGVYQGRLTAMWNVELINKDLKYEYYAIDHFLGSSEHDKTINYYELTKNNLSSIIDNVNIIKNDSQSECNKYENEFFDIIYIDASHDYDAVIADIKAWLPKVKKNGIICGDDYIDGWPGVIKAVDEMFRNKVTRIGNQQWMVKMNDLS
jgi:hypothetical protein